MAVIAQLPAKNIIDGFRGTLDFYVKCGHGSARTVCVRKWPVTPRANLTPGTIAAQRPFAIAASSVSLVSQEIKDLYFEMAAGTSYTWKDVAMSLYLKNSKIYKVFD